MPKGKNVKKVLHRDAFGLPSNPTATGERCFQIVIPDDNGFEESLFSCLALLGKWNMYQQDGGHIAADVAQRWREIIYFGGITRCKPLVADNGVEIEDMARFRVKPDDNCVLQIECAPDEWEDFWDIRECAIAGATQEGPGGSGPGPGEERVFCTTLQGSGSYLLPINVEPGDVITVYDVSGGWHDGSIPFAPPWYCPNGQAYEFGNCSGGTSTNPADPLPTAPHMKLLVSLDGALYEYDQPINVPATTTVGQVQFFANDDQLFDNGGSIKFCVKIANKSQQTFTHHFDLRNGLQGWMIRTDIAVAPFPEFVPGIGIQATNPSGAPGQGLFELGMNMPGTYGGLTVRYQGHTDHAGSGEHGIYNVTAPFQWNTATESFANSSTGDVDESAAFTLSSECIKVNNNVDTVGDTNTITDIYISGNGPDPFEA